jgi:hypothetical protein
MPVGYAARESGRGFPRLDGRPEAAALAFLVRHADLNMRLDLSPGVRIDAEKTWRKNLHRSLLARHEQSAGS